MRIPKIQKFPKTLLVGEEEYDIVIRRKIWKSCPKQVGQCDLYKKRIQVRSGQTLKEAFSTLVHEIVHALDKEYNIKLKHKQVYKLERALVALFIENF